MKVSVRKKVFGGKNYTKDEYACLRKANTNFKTFADKNLTENNQNFRSDDVVDREFFLLQELT